MAKTQRRIVYYLDEQKTFTQAPFRHNRRRRSYRRGWRACGGFPGEPEDAQPLGRTGCHAAHPGGAMSTVRGRRLAFNGHRVALRRREGVLSLVNGRVDEQHDLQYGGHGIPLDVVGQGIGAGWGPLGV